MAKLNKHELKRQFKEQILTLKKVIKAYCYGCNGYGIDGFDDCKVWGCPLHLYRTTHGDHVSQKYKAIFSEMDKIKNGKCEISQGSWTEFFEKENLATNITKKKENLTQLGGDVDD